MRNQPSRTCLGCRRVKPKTALVRLIRTANGVVLPDPAARAAGRGAYVCAEPLCIERGLQRARLSHAFRKPCAVGPGLATMVEAAGRAAADGPNPAAASVR